MNPIYAPLYVETLQFFHALDSLDDSWLRSQLDASFSAIEIDTNGDTIIAQALTRWLWYINRQFAVLDAVGVKAVSTILSYEGRESDSLGYSVVRFRRQLSANDQHLKQTCIATLIWTCTPDGWKLLRWHCTAEDREVCIAD